MFDPAFVLSQAGRRTALQSESADPATAGKHDQYQGKEPAKTTAQQRIHHSGIWGDTLSTGQ